MRLTGSVDGEKTIKNTAFGDTIRIRIGVPVFVVISTFRCFI